ncbi:MAG: hypothetical protein ACKO1H_15580 [Tabrizicola sp.]
MWNFSLLKALALWGRLVPLMAARLFVFGLGAVALGVAMAIGVWAGGRLGLMGGANDAVLGGLAGLLLAAGILGVFGRARVRAMQSQLIALISDMLGGVRVPMGQGQVAHARSAVAARFGSAAQLQSIHRFVRGVSGRVAATGEGVAPLLALPILGRLLTGGLVDQMVLAHAYRARPENAWEATHDGLVLATQNAHELLGNAFRINGIGWLLTLAAFLFLLPPFVAFAALVPLLGPASGAIAAGLAALAVRSALIQPFVLACQLQAFRRITAGQQPLGEWRGRLTQISTLFRELGDRAIGWAPETGPNA